MKKVKHAYECRTSSLDEMLVHRPSSLNLSILIYSLAWHYETWVVSWCLQCSRTQYTHRPLKPGLLDPNTSKLTTRPIFICSMLGSVTTIFWSLFGQVDPGSFQFDESEYDVIWKTGLFLFGAFNIVAVLVALNMLIAILNDSYVQITVRIELISQFFNSWLC